MGRLYRRREGGAWWGDWQTPDGRRHRASLRTADARVARERLRQAELAATDPTAHRAAQGLSAALDYMITVASADRSEATRRFYEQKARHLVRILGDVDVATLERVDVAAYTHQRISEGASPHTVQKELVTLRRALVEAHNVSPLPRHPRDVIPTFAPQYQPRTRHLSEREFDALLATTPPRRKLWLLVAVYTGAELGALERLEWSHVDLRAGAIRLPGTKRQARNRLVPIAAPLLPWLESAMRSRRTGLVFGAWGNVRRDLARYCELARVPAVTPNDLRRTFASWLKQRGIDSRTVADLLGHSSTRMVDLVYGRLTPAVYAAAVASLPSCAAGVPDAVPLVARPGARGTARPGQKAAKSQESGVPRAGIEPATRGFSVPVAAGQKLRVVR
jgi:integrase